MYETLFILTVYSFLLEINIVSLHLLPSFKMFHERIYAYSKPIKRKRFPYCRFLALPFRYRDYNLGDWNSDLIMQLIFFLK